MWLKASVAFRVSFFWQVCWVAVVSRILCKPTACLGWPPCTGLDEVGVRRRVCWVFWPSARLGGARLDGAPRITEHCEPCSMGRAQAGREGESYNSWMERSGRIKKKLWMIHLRDKWLLNIELSLWFMVWVAFEVVSQGEGPSVGIIWGYLRFRPLDLSTR